MLQVDLRFPIILVLLGFSMAFVYGARIHTIECVRDSSGKVGATITHSGIIDRQKEVIPVGELLRAELAVKSSKDSKGKSVTSHQVRLITLKYTTLFTNSSSYGYKETSSQVKQINYFIQKSTQKSMSLTQDDRPFLYIFGGICGIMGLLFLLSPPRG